MVIADRSAPRFGRALVVPALLWLLVIALMAVQVVLTFAFDWRRVPDAFRPNSSSVAVPVGLASP